MREGMAIQQRHKYKRDPPLVVLETLSFLLLMFLHSVLYQLILDLLSVTLLILSRLILERLAIDHWGKGRMVPHAGPFRRRSNGG